MTTIVESIQSDPTLGGAMPPGPKGVLPRVGQFVCLMREGRTTTGWLMEEMKTLDPDPLGRVCLVGKVLSAEGVVAHARGSRQEWLDSERDDRDPSATALFAVHRRHKAELGEIVSDAHEFADDNDLCGEFDRFLEKHDLPSRNGRDQFLTVRVTATVTVSGAGRTEEDAFDSLGREQVFEALRETMTNYPQSVDYELDC